MLYEEFVLDVEKLKAVLAALDTEVNGGNRGDVVAGLLLVAMDITARISDWADACITCDDLVV